MKRAAVGLVALVGATLAGIAIADPLDDATAAYRRGDYAAALPVYRSLADQGNATAQVTLGLVYASGRGVVKDDAEAVKWFRKAADQGDASGQNELGLMYHNGRGLARDDTEAITWFRKAAAQGYASAEFNIGGLYEQGAGVAQDYAEAVRWYSRAAQQGRLDAQYRLGVLYEGGTGVAEDREAARQWYDQVMASPRTDQASLAVKQSARQRLAKLSGLTEEAVPYEGGRFVIARPQQGACVVALQGIVSRDTAFVFDQVIAKSATLGCIKPWLLLESPGGLLENGIRLGRAVRLGDFRTITRYGCASACAMIFVGGTERVLVGSRAAIGLHQASLPTGRGTGHRCITSPMSDAALDIKRYLRWAIPAQAEQVIERTMGTSCDTVDWVRGQRAIDLAIATRLESEDVDIYGPREGRLQ